MIDINESVMQFLLAFVVVGPLLGAVAALLPAPPGLKGKSPEQAVLRHGVTVTGAVLIAAIVLALGFDHDHPSKMQATTDISWIPALDVRIHLGIDGISLPLLVLPRLTFLCALYSCFKPPSGPSPKAFVALLLLAGRPAPSQTVAVLDPAVGFAFKTAAVPFHFWVPDTYVGAPLPAPRTCPSSARPSGSPG
ncbi:NAD(P)H-quinone oxidoreductase chain 4 [Streptomyces canarius]